MKRQKPYSPFGYGSVVGDGGHAQCGRNIGFPSPQPSPRGEGVTWSAGVESRELKKWVRHWLRQLLPKAEGEFSRVDRRIPARYSVKRSRAATPSPWGEGRGEGEWGAACAPLGRTFQMRVECRVLWRFSTPARPKAAQSRRTPRRFARNERRVCLGFMVPMHASNRK
jgi:hypothetical protein